MGILPVDPIYKASLDGVNTDFMFFFGRALAGIYFLRQFAKRLFAKILYRRGHEGSRGLAEVLRGGLV